VGVGGVRPDQGRLELGEVDLDHAVVVAPGVGVDLGIVAEVLRVVVGEVFQLGLWTLATIPFFALRLWLGWHKVKNNEPRNAPFN